MRLEDDYQLKANVDIKIIDVATGRLKEELHCHNTGMDAWRNLLRDVYGGAQNNAEISYMGWGTGTTTPDRTRSQMTAEKGRKPVTQYVNGATGVVIVRTILTSNDANGLVIGEFGLFGGGTAAGTINTGTMAAWALWPGGTHTKLNTESIQVDWTITIS